MATNNTLDALKNLAQQGVIHFIDFYFAELLQRLASAPSGPLLMAGCLASRQSASGDVCISLEHYASQLLFEGEKDLQADETLRAPPLVQWVDRLKKSGVVGSPGDLQPLILVPDGKDVKLYLHKLWLYEKELCDYLLRQMRPIDLKKRVDYPALTAALQRYFNPSGTAQHDATDWQQIACVLAVANHLCVISGGPGTGKTTTVTKILAILVEQHQALAGSELRIGLAAPTGKAAARLSESIKAAKLSVIETEAVRAMIPEKSHTLHRLLGYNRDRASYYYHAENRLHLDVLIVDEASMVDLALLRHLVCALPTQCRLILLGDKDQLASVEAGSVLADICSFGTAAYSGEIVQLFRQVMPRFAPPQSTARQIPLQDNLCFLQKSYRFDEHSGIGLLAQHINHGQAKEAIALLQKGNFPDLSWSTDTSDYLSQWVLNHYSDYRTTQDPQEALRRFNQQRVLCAMRETPLGTLKINRFIESVLTRHGHISTESTFYPGRPIMITRNNYQLQLFNGDIGLILADKEDNNRLKAFFVDAKGDLRRVSPARLPEHETVYAMTIHKSQGSEFNQVLILMPHRDSPILTRELIYTGLTRARHHCVVISDLSLLQWAISRQVQRKSGLTGNLRSRFEPQQA